MIGMLVVAALDRGRFVFHGGFGGAGFLDIAQMEQRRMLALEAHLVEQRNALRFIEGADGKRDVLAAIVAIVERRSAILAEAAPNMLGAAELGWLAARPGEGRAGTPLR